MLTFDDFADGFDCCREANKPIDAEIKGVGHYKLYPSGWAGRMFDSCPECQKDLGETLPIASDGTCHGCGANWGYRYGTRDAKDSYRIVYCGSCSYRENVPTLEMAEEKRKEHETATGHWGRISVPYVKVDHGQSGCD